MSEGSIAMTDAQQGAADMVAQFGGPGERVATMERMQLGRHSVMVHVDEDQVALRARRIVANPAATIDEVRTWVDEGAGALGRFHVVVRAHIGIEALMDEERSVGDAGGADDRLVAHAARLVTGESDPRAVAEALGRHHVRAIGDLPRALGMLDGEAISTEVRAELASALGLVEPPLPDWVRPGVVVAGPWGRARAVVDVGTRGVLLDGDAEPRPAGVFLWQGWKPA